MTILCFQQVVLHWNDISINCNIDVLQVGGAANKRKKDLSYCSYSNTLAPVKSSGRKLTISLNSERYNDERHIGFYATYHTYDGEPQGRGVSKHATNNAPYAHITLNKWWRCKSYCY